MERLMKELLLEKQKLEQLKADVNNMEYDALQRRLQRVNSTSLIPRVRTECLHSLTSALLLFAQFLTSTSTNLMVLLCLMLYAQLQIFCDQKSFYTSPQTVDIFPQVHKSEYFRLCLIFV